MKQGLLCEAISLSFIQQASFDEPSWREMPKEGPDTSAVCDSVYQLQMSQNFSVFCKISLMPLDGAFNFWKTAALRAPVFGFFFFSFHSTVTLKFWAREIFAEEKIYSA